MSDEADVENYMQLAASPEVARKWFSKAKIAASSLTLFLRLTASFVAAACDAWFRKQNALVRKLKDLVAAPSVVVFSPKLSFPSLTDALTHSGGKFESIFLVLSKVITSCRTSNKWFSQSEFDEANALEPEKSVHVDVLYDPYPASARADVIFIHGLHGSLFHTWKQGLWSHRKGVQNLQLKYEYKMHENPKTRPSECLGERSKVDRIQGTNEKRERCCSDRNHDHDHLLENITDLINNIDDKIKSGRMSQEFEDADDEPYSPCWPRDWLPKDCPSIRVIAVNYTTDPFLWRPVWISKRIRSSMTQRSREMEDILLELGVGRRPVVWVGHSKGGLFVKQMLVDAKNSEDPRLSILLRQTKGIMFYSVPHRGSSLAHWNLPLFRQSIELTEVKRDCLALLDLHNKFIKLYEEKSLTAEVFSFVETILTFMFITNVRVVSVDSADLGLGSFHGVNIDHREICKPLNRDCFLYKELTNLINRVV